MAQILRQQTSIKAGAAKIIKTATEDFRQTVAGKLRRTK